MGITKFTRRKDRVYPADESVTDTIVEINWQTIDWIALLAEGSSWKADAIDYLVHVIRADLIRSLMPAEAIQDDFIDGVVQQSLESVLDQQEEFSGDGSFLDWATAIGRQVLLAAIRQGDLSPTGTKRPTDEVAPCQPSEVLNVSSHSPRKTHA